MVDKKNTIQLDFASVFLRKDGIVETVISNNTVIDKAQCVDLLSAYSQILANKKYPLLLLVGDFATATKEAREFSASKAGLKYSKVEAYVFNSLPHRILANFYVKINKPPVPTKFFKTKQEAVAWLLKFR